jgi:fumarate reductase subunit D
MKKGVFVRQLVQADTRLDTFHPGITALTLLTAGAHLYLGMQPDEELHTWFLLNALGYLILLAAFVLPQFMTIHAVARGILLGYTALTIVLWVFLGSPKEGKLDPFDVLVKGVEIFLLLFLLLDWRWDSRQRIS